MATTGIPGKTLDAMQMEGVARTPADNATADQEIALRKPSVLRKHEAVDEVALALL